MRRKITNMRRYTANALFPYDNDEDGVSKESKLWSVLTKVLIPLGAGFAALLAVLIQKVPLWVTVVVVAYLVVTALVVVALPAFQLYKKLRDMKMNRDVARHYLPLISRFVVTLKPNLDESRGDSVYYLWKSAISLEDGLEQRQKQIRPDHDHLRSLKLWLDSIDARLNSKHKRDFDILCEELADVVLQYNGLCQKAHREIEAALVNKKPEEHKLRPLKQDWANARDKHNQTVKAWTDLAKNINHDSHRRICFDTCELLKTIES